MYQQVHAVLLREAFDQIILVLLDPPDEVIGNTDIECPITSAGQYVDVACHNRPFSGFRPSPE